MNKYRYRKIYSSSPGLFLYPILQAADILLYKVQKISKLKKKRFKSVYFCCSRAAGNS